MSHHLIQGTYKGIKILSIIAAAKLEWSYIQELVSILLIPVVRKHVNDAVAFGILALILWVDKPRPVVKELIDEVYSSFEKYVLEVTAIYTSKTPQITREALTIRIITSANAVKEVVTERDIATSDLPGLVREEMITYFEQPIQLDVKLYLEKMVKERWQ